MADTVIDSSQVFPSSAAHIIFGLKAHHELKAGDWVYLNSSNKWSKPLVPPGGGWALSDMRGVALAHAYADQPVGVVLDDPDLQLGGTGTLNVPVMYIQSYTLGKIRPISDAASGQYVFTCGISKSSNVLNLKPSGSPVLIP